MVGNHLPSVGNHLPSMKVTDHSWNEKDENDELTSQLNLLDHLGGNSLSHI